MLLKLIQCDVIPNQELLFSQGQVCWSETRNSKGFIKQFGGWNNSKATIFALWKDEASMDSFMSTDHDAIAEKANQSCSYATINVSYFERVMEIPKEHLAFHHTPELIRVAECEVIEGKEGVFLDTQRQVWNGGMSLASGMLGGDVWRSTKNKNNYLVTTWWRSNQDHDNYMNENFPELLKKAQTGTYLSNVQGYQFEIEELWGVNK